MRWVVVLVVALAALGMWHMMSRKSAPFKWYADPMSETAQQAYAIEFSGSTLEPHVLSGTKTCDGRYTYGSLGYFVRDDGQRRIIFQQDKRIICDSMVGSEFQYIENTPRETYSWTVSK